MHHTQTKPEAVPEVSKLQMVFSGVLRKEQERNIQFLYKSAVGRTRCQIRLEVEG